MLVSSERKSLLKGQSNSFFIFCFRRILTLGHILRLTMSLEFAICNRVGQVAGNRVYFLGNGVGFSRNRVGFSGNRFGFLKTEQAFWVTDDRHFQIANSKNMVSLRICSRIDIHPYNVPFSESFKFYNSKNIICTMQCFLNINKQIF